MKIALIGKAKQTRHYIKTIPEDVQRWAVSSVIYDLDNITCDAMFEIHPRWMLESPKYKAGFWDWLTSAEHAATVFTDGFIPEIANSEPYPLEYVVRLCGNLTRGAYLSSTLDYMLALAIAREDVTDVTLIGFEMGTSTEHKYQVPGAAFWIGQAVARGIRVHIPAESSILPPQIYGQGGQMIPRQKLEQKRIEAENIMNTARANYNRLTGVIQERQARLAIEQQAPARNRHVLGLLQRELDKAGIEWQAARDTLQQAEGGFEMIGHLIKTVDIPEPQPV